MELSGGQPRRRRFGPGAAIAAAIALIAAPLSGCGDDSSDSEEARGPYRAQVVQSEFPPRQTLGETALMRVGVRNVGRETIPELTIGVTIGGRDGEASSLPFGVRDQQPELAEPDRPVWVLAEHYPKLAGSDDPGGAETSTTKVFSFGPLKPDRTTEVVWKLTASRAGRYDIHYRVGAGPNAEQPVETQRGVQPGGTFSVEISEEPVATTVTDDGRVVEIDEQSRGGG